jgi:hypothetical protein
VAPRAEGTLEIEVLSGDTPLPEAQVQIYEREPADLLAPLRRWSGWNSGETDADGRRVVPAAPGSYYVTARAPGLAPGYAAVVHPPGPVQTHVQLRLEATMELRGTTVVKGTGDPISLAEIILTPPTFEPGAGNRPEAPEEESATATSDESGEFQLPGLAPGRYRVEARAPGYVSAVLPSVPIPFGARITLELIPGGQLEGVVLRTNGEPAVGAEVLAASRQSSATTITDDEGRFMLDVPAGTHAVSSRRGEEAGALDREVKLTVGQRLSGLRLQLDAGAQVSGTVVRREGPPIPAARVEARPPGTSTASGMADTDENGSFTLSRLAAATYDIRVTVPGGGFSEHGPITLATGENPPLTLTYDPRGNLECFVSKNRQPAEGVLVRLTDLPVHAPGDRNVVEARTNAAGYAAFRRLPLGRFRAEAFLEAGSQSASALAAVSQGNPYQCFLKLPGETEPKDASVSVEGQVLQSSGEPPATPVSIYAFRQNPSKAYKEDTDAQGRFRLALTPGQYLLRAVRQRGFRCGSSGQLQLQVEAGQQPEATIRLEPMSEPALRFQVLGSDGAPARLTQVSVSTAAFQENVTTDEQGRIDVCLPPGLRLQAGAPLLTVSSSDGMRTAVIEQATGQRDFILYLGAMPTIRGRIIAPSGVPIRRFTVDLIPPGIHFATSSFTGDRFSLSAPAGQTQLLVSAHDTLGASVVLDLRPGDHKELEIAVFPGVTMTGRLVDAATRQPVKGASIYILGLQRNSASEDGRFVFNNVPAGEHFLDVYRQRLERTRLLVKLLPGQANNVGDFAVP